MNDNSEFIIAKKRIQKELLNELCNIGFIDFVNANNSIKKLEEDIKKLQKINENDIDVENIIVKIPI